MKAFKNTLLMTEEEWLESRRKGIGGSDAGTILGLNPWQTPYELWEYKTTGKRKPMTPQQKEAVYWGTVLEPVVAKRFAEENNKKVQRCNFMLQHSEYDFMLANIDRNIVAEDAILECKTTSAYKADAWKEEEIPASYIVQCQHYMAVTGVEKCYIACLIGGQKYVDKVIEKDNEFIEFLIQKEKEFWECVKNNTPPTDTPAVELYVKDNGETIELDLLQDLTDWDLIVEKEKELKAQKEEVKTRIQNKMKDNQTATWLNRKVTWKTQVTNRLDTKRLKEEQPQIYQQYLVASETRKFTVK